MNVVIDITVDCNSYITLNLVKIYLFSHRLVVRMNKSGFCVVCDRRTHTLGENKLDSEMVLSELFLI